MQTGKRNNKTADPIEVEGDKTFPGPPDEKHLVKPDGDMRLSNCTLRDALDSAYAMLVANLLGRGYPPSKKLFEEEIPAMVFELGFGAGWLEVTEAALTPDEVVREKIANQDPEYKGRKLVLFGDLMIDTWYKEAFLAILAPSISDHMRDPANRADRFDALPDFTSKKEREDLLQQYLEDHASDKVKIGMTDVADMAWVDYRDLKRWRKGPPTATEPRGLPDSSIKAKRIAILLRFNDRTEKPKHKSTRWNISPSHPHKSPP